MSTPKNEGSVFRPEALQHKQEGWLGPSRLHIPSTLFVCLSGGFMMTAIIVLIIAVGAYSERINVTGRVTYEPPAISLIAQRDGVITHSRAGEGTIVRRGETVFSISSDTRTNLGETSAERVALLKEQRKDILERMNMATGKTEVNRLYLTRKITNKENEIESLRRLISKFQEHEAWFKQKSEQYTRLRGKGIALDAELINRMKDFYLAAENISSAEVREIALSEQLLDLEHNASLADGDLHEALKIFNAEIAGIDQKILDAENIREALISAPFDGKITSIIAHLGEPVSAGQRLAVLIPTGAVVRVELLSPSDSLGEVAPGQRVRMKIAAYPYQWYGKMPGIIETVSATPVNMTLPAQTPGRASEKELFRIVVRPELTQQQTKFAMLPGMEVKTEIYVKTRKIYEWLFVPINRAYARATEGLE